MYSSPVWVDTDSKPALGLSGCASLVGAYRSEGLSYSKGMASTSVNSNKHVDVSSNSSTSLTES